MCPAVGVDDRRYRRTPSPPGGGAVRRRPRSSGVTPGRGRAPQCLALRFFFRLMLFKLRAYVLVYEKKKVLELVGPLSHFLTRLRKDMARTAVLAAATPA